MSRFSPQWPKTAIWGATKTSYSMAGKLPNLTPYDRSQTQSDPYPAFRTSASCQSLGRLILGAGTAAFGKSTLTLETIDGSKPPECGFFPLLHRSMPALGAELEMIEVRSA
jgi:hypothetical protein